MSRVFGCLEGDNQTCIGDEVMADCYASCWEQNQCGRCNWSGCYDERLFIVSIIEAISAVLCIEAISSVCLIPVSKNQVEDCRAAAGICPVIILT